MPAEPPVEDRLRVLRARFDARLREDAAEIARQADAAASEEAARGDALREVRATAHRLAGAAGTFGRPEAGSLAREIEAEAERLIAAPEQGTAELRALAETLIRLAAPGGLAEAD